MGVSIEKAAAALARHTAEATLAGLTLLGPAEGERKGDAQYRFYRMEECGHSFNIQPGNVRLNRGIVCPLCTQERFKDEAKAHGLELIGPCVSDLLYPHMYRLYRFESCGHFGEFQLREVRAQKCHCKHCEEERFAREAEAAGLELLGPPLKWAGSGTRSYRYKTCGHIFDSTTTKVREGGVSCTQCRRIRHAEEAKAAGLELLSFTTIPGLAPQLRRYRVIKCGHEIVTSLHSVSTGKASCSVCNPVHSALYYTVAEQCAEDGIQVITETMGTATHIKGVHRTDLKKSVRVDLLLERSDFKQKVLCEIDGAQHFGCGYDQEAKAQRIRDARLDSMLPTLRPDTSIVRLHQSTPISVAIQRIITAGTSPTPIHETLLDALNLGNGKIGQHSKTFHAEYREAILQACDEYGVEPDARFDILFEPLSLAA